MGSPDHRFQGLTGEEGKKVSGATGGAKGNRGDAGPRGEEYNSTFFSQTQKATPAKRYKTVLANKAQRLKGKGLRPRLFGAGIEDTTRPRLGRRCGIGPIGLENSAGLLGCLAGA
jgi:hypothetical protein